jgi:uncharacterized protein DUF1566
VEGSTGRVQEGEDRVAGASILQEKETMKKPPLVILAISVAALANQPFPWKPLAVWAADSDSVPIGNGDVNGDGNIDLSDAVSIISWLFLGGPEPLPCPVPPELTKRIAELESQLSSAQVGLGDCQRELEVAKADVQDLKTQMSQLQEALTDCQAGNCPKASLGLPDTGQTKCYELSGSEVPCDIANCPGQDGFYSTGCPAEDRFIDHGDGTITDLCTGLMWQRDKADVDGDGEANDRDRLPWCMALEYCENLSLAGHDDWRLPNVRELQSIVDYGRFNLSIDSTFDGFPSWYWSSTPHSGQGWIWIVTFNDGLVSAHIPLDQPLYVRAVRNAP